ncbi:MAG: dockerin type I repeat-containing protein [Planctomycetota bacterium]
MPCPYARFAQLIKALTKPRSRFAGIALLLATIGSTSVQAAVTAVGGVYPVPPVDGGTFDQTIFVGADFISGGPYSSLTIDSGSLLETPQSITAGASEGEIGDIFVTDPGSQLRATTVLLGDRGLGLLDVSNGGSVITDNLRLSIGSEFSPSSYGAVRISGSRSFVSVNNELSIGEISTGRLEVTDGARLLTPTQESTSEITHGTVVIDGAGSIWQNLGNGLVNSGGELHVINGGHFIDGFWPTLSGGIDKAARTVVTGAGSRWSFRGLLQVGSHAGNVGVLRVENAGLVESLFGGVPGGIAVRSGSAIRLDGGEIRTSQPIENSGTISGGGVISRTDDDSSTQKALENNEFGLVHVGQDETLRIEGFFVNLGDVFVEGGTLEVTRTMTQTPSLTGLSEGGITLNDGNLLLGQGLLSDNDRNVLPKPTVASIGGTNNVFGPVFAGRILVTGDSHLVFHDDVDDVTLNLKAGSTLTAFGDLSFGTGGDFDAAHSLELDLGGDPIEVAGEASLNGVMDLTLASGTQVLPGQQFDIISSAEQITGGFFQINLPEVDGIMWRVEQTTNLLSVGAEFAGDYNGDGLVDVADYTMWRDALTSQDLLADGNGDGTVDTDDYAMWKSNYGATAAAAIEASAAASTQVPEPHAVLLLTLAITATMASRRWLFRRQ